MIYRPDISKNNVNISSTFIEFLAIISCDPVDMEIFH